MMEDLLAKLNAFVPCCEQEEVDKRRILAVTQQNPQTILTRENEWMHMTSSGFVLNPARDKALMVYHNIYQTWSWAGGHADGDSDLLACALREVREETGVKADVVSTEIASLDVLRVIGHQKNGRYVGAHLHLSAAFLLTASEDQPLTVKLDENSGVRWIALEELESCCEPHMVMLYQKLISKGKRL